MPAVAMQQLGKDDDLMLDSAGLEANSHATAGALAVRGVSNDLEWRANLDARRRLAIFRGRLKIQPARRHAEAMSPGDAVVARSCCLIAAALCRGLPPPIGDILADP